jgi:membrane associated rhomboid family serine protease
VFDISTPQVSTSAHLCGLVTGFAIGLVVAPKRTSF